VLSSCTEDHLLCSTGAVLEAQGPPKGGPHIDHQGGAPLVVSQGVLGGEQGRAQPGPPGVKLPGSCREVVGAK